MIVIGAGRVGSGLETSAKAHGLPMTLIDRTTGWATLDAPAGDPVMLAVRNDDLREILPRIPIHRRDDLVFVQNGAIRELLDGGPRAWRARPAACCTSSPPDEGSRRPPAGTMCSPVRGPPRWRRGSVRIGLPSEAVDAAAFAEVELEKLLWLACNGVLCEVHAATVGGIADEHRPELETLVGELAPVGRAAWGVRADERWLVDRMVAYSRAIPEYRASVKEWPWRNGWLRAQAAQHGLPTPIHDALLARLGR